MASQMMQVVVPPQLPPNRMLVVQAPSGQRIQVQVPPNVQPGQSIQVQVPAAAAPAEATPTVAPVASVLVLRPRREKGKEVLTSRTPTPSTERRLKAETPDAASR